MGWITAASVEIYEGADTSVETISEVIARHAAPLVALLKESRRVHDRDDDGVWCEKNYDGTDACTCGADEWNARVDAVLKEEK